jgi:hypothetical protein
VAAGAAGHAAHQALRDVLGAAVGAGAPRGHRALFGEALLGDLDGQVAVDRCCVVVVEREGGLIRRLAALPADALGVGLVGGFALCGQVALEGA